MNNTSKPKKVYFVAGVNGGTFLSPMQIKALRPSKSSYRPFTPAAQQMHKVSHVKKAALTSAPSILSITSGENCTSCGKKRRKRQK